jgi:hypothetical protein
MQRTSLAILLLLCTCVLGFAPLPILQGGLQVRTHTSTAAFWLLRLCLQDEKQIMAASNCINLNGNCLLLRMP